MIIRNQAGLAAIVSLLSLFLVLSCSSNDEPGPVDCVTSNLTVSFTLTDPTSCSAADGSITATATRGVEPYQFALDAQSYGATFSFTGLGAGTYLLKVKDKNGCESSTSVTLKSSDSSLAATMEITDSGCKTSNGAVIINATGGTAPYFYKVNNGAPSSTNAFFGLSTGSYAIKVTDNTGCSVTQTVKVTSGIKFSENVKKIIDTNCVIIACHGEDGNISFKVLANIQASAKDVKARTQSGNMPKNGPKLQQADLDAIACWVDDGARDN
jgi:SprB repeat